VKSPFYWKERVEEFFKLVPVAGRFHCVGIASLGALMRGKDELDSMRKKHRIALPPGTGEMTRLAYSKGSLRTVKRHLYRNPNHASLSFTPVPISYNQHPAGAPFKIILES
jgi:hypothetical protein